VRCRDLKGQECCAEEFCDYETDLNEAALRRTHSRVAEPTVEVI
jgi:hypothetical protein